MFSLRFTHFTAALQQFARHLTLTHALWALAIASVLALLPAVVLLAGSTPMADDFCTPSWVFKHGGFANMLQVYYQTWSGRMLSHGLIGLPAIVAMPFPQFFPLANAIIFATLAASLALFFSVGVPRRSAAIFTIVGLAWWVWHLPAVRDALYWYAASVTYTINLPLMLLAIVGLFGVMRAPSWATLPLTLLTATSLLALTSTNEIAGLLAIALAANACLWPRLTSLRRSQLIFLLLIAIAGMAFVVMAPGNAVRRAASIAAGTGGQPLLLALAGGLPMGLGLIFKHLTLAMAVWLAWVALWVSVFPIGRAAFWRWAAGAGVASLAIVIIAPAFGLLANGETLPVRTENQLFTQLWLALTSLTIWATQTYGLPLKKAQQRPTLIALTLTLAVSLVASSAWVRGTNETRKITQLRASFEQRHQLLSSGATSVPPLATTPKTLYEETLFPQPNNWQNVCVADYYRLPSVQLTTP